ncbi:MAG: hypothetical protein AMJ73_06860 [candidate division Zixibacteria bacterium SM1_73]|nr:MAG: hypothetical protein AMJ73_06860 [candidate division Zixibacteria bacterium SM1_73]
MKSSAFAIISVLAVLTFSYGESFCQKWGKASKEELSMTSVPEDPDADAVILFDKGEYFFGYIYPVTFREHKRVKVFTKRGTEFANISIPFLHGEKIKELEGQTITQEGKKLRLKQNQVFTRKGKDWDEIVFTLPGVEKGCVFEYRYEKWSEYTYVLGPWYFQNEIFIKLSQISLRLYGPWVYSYRFVNPGLAKIEPRVQAGNITHPGEMEYIWTFENVPAIREEPYVDCIHDYRTGVYFERVGYERVDSRTREAIDTWRELGDGVDSLYKSFTHGKERVKEKALELTKSMATQPEKAVKIYDYVRQNIDWNGERGIFNFEERYLETVMTRLEGTAAEKNLLLLNLLNSAGIEAYPLLISTRDHGRVIRNLPGLFQFNHLIVYVKPFRQLGGEEWFVDAVDRFCPFGMLSVDDLVSCGFMLNDEESRIIEIPPCKVGSRKHFITQGELREDGGLVCSSAVGYHGHFRINARKQFVKQGREAFAKQVALRIIPTASIDTITYTALDSIDKPLKMNFTLTAPHYARVIGENLYVNPTLFSRVESNPFKNESRSFPVDFSYPFTEIEKTELSIPSGFEIEELPENVYREIGGAEFSKTFSVEGNVIKCYRELAITQPVFLVQYYQVLRNFYQEVVNADQLMVVLTKEHE